jgi:creatinine amidohydrolase/Fe(II)-dependent formamide hydrolase-like protein
MFIYKLVAFYSIVGGHPQNVEFTTSASNEFRGCVALSDEQVNQMLAWAWPEDFCSLYSRLAVNAQGGAHRTTLSEDEM